MEAGGDLSSYVGVYVSCGNTRVAEQFLNGSDILSVFQESCCKRMPQCMNRSWFINTALQECSLEGILKGMNLDVAIGYGEEKCGISFMCSIICPQKF